MQQLTIVPSILDSTHYVDVITFLGSEYCIQFVMALYLREVIFMKPWIVKRGDKT